MSIAMKRHHDHSSSYKENIELSWLAYSWEIQSITIIVRSMAGGMAVYRQMWCWVHIDQKATGRTVTLSKVKQKELKACPIVTHFLQQGPTYSNKATLPNSATLYEFMGASDIQTTPGARET